MPIPSEWTLNAQDYIVLGSFHILQIQPIVEVDIFNLLSLLFSKMVIYIMFHINWTTFKFNRNQLGTVSAFVMISVPCQ